MLSAAGGSANEASLPEPIGSKPTASLRLRRRLRLLPRFAGVGVVFAWCVLFRVLAPTSSSPSSLRSSPTSPALQIAGYLFPWCLLAPLRVTVVAALPPRSAAGGLPLVPFGYSQHVAAEHEFQRTSSQLTVSIRVRGAVDERACLAALSPTCGRRWRGDRGGLRSVAVRVRKRHAFGKNAGRNRHEKPEYRGSWIISRT